MDNNLIHPTPQVPQTTAPQPVAAEPGYPTYSDVTPVSTVAQVPVASPPAETLEGSAPSPTPVSLPVQPAAPAPVMVQQAAAPTEALTVTPIQQQFTPVFAGAAPQSTTVVPPRRKHDFSSAGRLLAIFGIFAVTMLFATMLFRKGEAPQSPSSQSNQVIPEQDLDSSVTLTDNLQGQAEAKTLIVNGGIRLQGALNFSSGQYLGGFVQGDLTSNQTYTLPDASGVLCLSSNNCSYVNAAQLAQLQTQVSSIQTQLQPQAFTAGAGIDITGETIQNTGVLTLNGQSGSVALTGGSGILVSGTSISNNGVLSLGGQSGALNLVSGPGISVSGLTISNNGVTSIQGLTGNVVFTAGSGIDITGTAVSNTGVTLLTGTANQVAVSGGTGSVTLSLPQDIAVTSSPTFSGLTANTVTTTTLTSASGLTVGATNKTLTLQGSTTQLTATNGANTAVLTFVNPTSNVTYRFATAAAGTYDVCTTTGNCTGVGGGVSTPGGTAGTIPKFTSSQGIGDSIITDSGTKVTINGDFDVTGVINGQLVSSDAHFTGNVTVDLNLGVTGTLNVNTITPTGALTVGSTGQNLLLQGSAVTLSSTSGGITNSLIFATPSGSNKTITIPNMTGTVCLTSGNCAGVGGTGDILQNGNSFGAAMTIGTNDAFALNFEANNSTAMTILTDGRVGIGTSSPAGKLHVYGSNPEFIVDNSGTGSGNFPQIVFRHQGANRAFAYWDNANANLIIRADGATSNGNVAFNTGATSNALYLKSDGKVGVGTNNPQSKLEVSGGHIRIVPSGTSAYIGFGSADGVSGFTAGRGVTASAHQFEIYDNTAGATRLFINSSGNISVGALTAAAKLHVQSGNLLLDNTFSYQGRNNASTAINLLGLDASNHLTLGATSGMANTNINAGTGNIAFATSAGTAMTILNGGNIGIGTTNPTRQLHIQSSAAVDINIALDNQSASGKHWLLQSKANGQFEIQGQAGGSAGAPGTSLFVISTGGFVGIGTNGPGGQLQVTASSASTVGQIVKAAASQTADLQQFQNSGGTVVAGVNKRGYGFFGYSADDTHVLSLRVGTASDIGLWVQGAASQTGNLTEWQDSTGTILSRITSNGGGRFGTYTGSAASNTGIGVFGTSELQTNVYMATDLSTERKVGIGTSSPSGKLHVETNTIGTISLVVKAMASQTGDLQQWQDSSANILASINSNGTLTLGASGNTTTNVAIAITSPNALNTSSGNGRPIKWYGNSTAFDSVTIQPVSQGNVGSAGLQIFTARSGGGSAARYSYFAQRDDATNGYPTVFSGLTLNSTSTTAAAANGVLTVFATTLQNDGITAVTNPGTTIFTDGTIAAVLAKPASTGMIIRAAASQTANLQEWQNSTGTVLSYVRSDGIVSAPSFIVSGGSGVTLSGSSNNVTLQSTSGYLEMLAAAASSIHIGTNSDTGTVAIHRSITMDNGKPFLPASTSSVALTVKGLASQTGDLQQWLSSTGSVLASVASDGKHVIGSVTNAASGSLLHLNSTGASPQFVISDNDFAASGANYYMQVASGNLYIGSSTNSGGAYSSLNDRIILNGNGNVGIGTGGAGNIGTNNKLIVGGPTTADNNALGMFNPSGSLKGVVIQGAAAQSANLFELQDSTAAVKAYFTVQGKGHVASTFVAERGLFGGVSSDSLGSATNGLAAYQASEIGLTVRGATSQSANLQEWQNSAGGALASMNNSGALALTGANYEAIPSLTRLYIKPQADTESGIIVRNFSPTSSANMQVWQNSAGSTVTYVDASGSVRLTNATYGFHYNDGGATTSRLGVKADTASTIVAILQGTTSQSADLTQWQNNSGTVLAKIDNGGNFAVATGNAVQSDYLTNSTNTGPYVQFTGTNGSMIVINRGNTANTPLRVDGMASQTGDLQQWRTSTGSNVARVDVSGRYVSASDLYAWDGDSAGQVRVGATGAGGGLSLGSGQDIKLARTGVGVMQIFGAGSATGTTLQIKALASQSANLQEWLNSSGTVMASVTGDGKMTVGVGASSTNTQLAVQGQSPVLGTFTSRTAAASNAWRAVAYGNGTYVAVSSSGTNRVMTSPDGITWTARTAAAANSWEAITYGNGLFVAVSTDGLASTQIMTSPDGITWTSRTAPSTGAWDGITYGNGLFVAVAQSGSNLVMTSPDGTTWTARTAAGSGQWSGVTYGNGLYVAVAYTGTNRVMTSPDGITWTTRTAAAANTWWAVTYGNGLFVAVSEDGTNRVMTSPDGITWTSRSASAASNWLSVTYGPGKFVATAYAGATQVMTSTDGITWTSGTVPQANTWTRITYGSNLFVGVSSDGTSQVMTASYTPQNSLVAKGSNVLQSVNSWEAALTVQDASANTLLVADTSTSRVGIGTAAPSYTLDMQANLSSNLLMRVGNTNASANAGILFSANSGGGIGTVEVNTSSDMIFRAGGITSTEERLRITNSGNVGIGTSSPSSYLAGVKGIAVFGSSNAGVSVATSNGYWMQYMPTGGSSLIFYSQTGGDRMTLTAGGNLRLHAYGAGTLVTDASGNVTASSDIRLKDVQGQFTRGLSDLLNLDPILYKWNGLSGLETESTYAGFSAQNVQSAIPEAVSTDSRGYLTLQDRPIIAASVNAIKELNGTSNALEARITALEGVVGANPTFASLNVTGPTTLASLTVTGDVSVQGKLTVANAEVTGNLTIGGHVITAGETPTYSVNSSAVGAASVTIDGNDTAGTITLVTGPENGLIKGQLAKVNFAHGFSSNKKVRVQITAGNDDATSAPVFVNYASTTNDSFELWTSQALASGKTYIFNYFVVE